MQKINLHLGAYGLLPSMIQNAFASAQQDMEERGTFLVSRDAFATHWRAQLNSKQIMQPVNAPHLGEKMIESALHSSSKVSTLTVSAEQFLYRQSLVSEGAYLTGSGYKIENFLRYFAEYQLDFHLVITHPACYRRALQQRAEKGKLQFGDPSAAPRWAPLVRELCSEIGGLGTLHVYNLEGGSKDILATFLANMLGTQNVASQSGWLRIIEKASKKIRDFDREASKDLSVSQLIEIDQAYEADLVDIASHEIVILHE